MFNPEMTASAINKMSERTLAANLGIEFTEVGVDFMCARMPVDSRTLQPYGLLHGGASIALAETMGSVASTALIDLSAQAAVGLDINGNHLRTVQQGYVIGTVRPIHIGRRTHVWEIRIEDESGRPGQYQSADNDDCSTMIVLRPLIGINLDAALLFLAFGHCLQGKGRTASSSSTRGLPFISTVPQSPLPKNA